MLLKNENSTDLYKPCPRLKTAELALTAYRLNLIAEDGSRLLDALRRIFSFFTPVCFLGSTRLRIIDVDGEGKYLLNFL